MIISTAHLFSCCRKASQNRTTTDVIPDLIRDLVRLEKVKPALRFISSYSLKRNILRNSNVTSRLVKSLVIKKKLARSRCGMGKKQIRDAVEELKANLDMVARVYEWAELMGYESAKLFSRHFLRHFGCRPSEILTEVRLRSIIEMLITTNKTCLEIAWAHSLPDEKALNSFTNRHLNTSPRKIQRISNKKLYKLMKIHGVNS